LIVFESVEQFELESNNFLNRFADSIADYRTHISKTMKASPYTIFDEHDMIERKSRVYKILKSLEKYDNLNDKLQQITIVVSASQSAWQAHSIERANSLVYRRSIENDGEGKWKAVSNGLTQSEGTIIAILAANPKNKFYAINNRGLFCSTDTGLAWRELDVSWSKEYLSQHPWALAVKGLSATCV
jgi:predicted RNA-binding protein with EMAP domain